MTTLLLTIHLAEPPPDTWVLAPGLLVAGLGMGMVAPTLVDHPGRAAHAAAPCSNSLTRTHHSG